MAIKKKVVVDMRYRRIAGMNRNIFYLALDGSAEGKSVLDASAPASPPAEGGAKA